MAREVVQAHRQLAEQLVAGLMADNVMAELADRRAKCGAGG